jgi:hypothetical protein
MFVCYNHLYKKVFKKAHTIVFCIITWLIGPIANIYFIQINAYHFDKITRTCMIMRAFSRLLLALLCIFGKFFYIKLQMKTFKNYTLIFRNNDTMLIIVLLLPENIY